MPLDPKQQPPYYTPATGGLPAMPIQTVFTQLTSQETTDTTAIETGIYTIPANTISRNGQIIEVYYWGNSYNSALGAIAWPTIFGQALGQLSWSGDKAFATWVQIIRTSPTTLRWLYKIVANATQYGVEQGSLTVDFTIDNEILQNIQAQTSGNMRLSAGYINILN